MDTEPTTTRSVSITAKLVLFVVFVVVLGFVVGVLISPQIRDALFMSSTTTPVFQPNVGLNENHPDTMPAGTLFASGVHTPSNNPAEKTPVIFSLDINKGEPISVLTNPFLFEPSLLRFFDPNNLYLSLLKTITPASLVEDEIPTMYLQTIDTQREEVLNIHTEARGPSVTSPEVSPDQRHLAFNRLIDESLNGTEEAFDIINWELVVTDFETGELVTIIDSAVHPQWSTNGEYFIFLTPESINIYHLTSGLITEALILQLFEGAGARENIQTGLDVSPDGQRLVVTSPYRNQIELFEIRSWQDGMLESLGRITTPGNQYHTPVFAPDGDFYAVYAVSRETDAAPGFEPRIEIRPTLGRLVAYEYLLNTDIEPEQFMLDDWILIPEGF